MTITKQSTALTPHFGASRRTRIAVLASVGVAALTGGGLLAAQQWGPDTSIIPKRSPQTQQRFDIPSADRYQQSLAPFANQSFTLTDAQNIQFFYEQDGTTNRYTPEQTDRDNPAHLATATAYTTIQAMLKNRPDLLYQLNQIGLEVHLKDTDDLKNSATHPNRVGGSATGGNRGSDGPLVITLAAKGKTLQEDTIHETGHQLEALYSKPGTPQNTKAQKAGYDGLIHEWNNNEVERFIAAREVEKAKIRAGESPMNAYAIKNDNNREFLTVLIETFFQKPEELKVSNQTLYTMMFDYFRMNPASEEFFREFKEKTDKNIWERAWDETWRGIGNGSDTAVDWLLDQLLPNR